MCVCVYMYMHVNGGSVVLVESIYVLMCVFIMYGFWVQVPYPR